MPIGIHVDQRVVHHEESIGSFDEEARHGKAQREGQRVLRARGEHVPGERGPVGAGKGGWHRPIEGHARVASPGHDRNGFLETAAHAVVQRGLPGAKGLHARGLHPLQRCPVSPRGLQRFLRFLEETGELF